MSIKIIIVKNLKSIFRSRMMLTLTLIIPLITILFVSITYDRFQNIPNVSIGYFSQSYSKTSLNIVNRITKKGLSMIKFSSKDLCEDSIKKNFVSACIVFSPNLDYSTKNNNLTIIVDYSRIGLAWQLENIILSAVSETNSNITNNLGLRLLDQLIETNNILNQQKSQLNKINLANGMIQTKTTTSASVLNTMNTTFQSSLFPFSDINTSIKNQFSSITNLRSEASSRISSIVSAINNVMSELNKINISSANKDIISQNLNRINGEINKINSLVTNLVSSSTNNYMSLKQQINTLNKNEIILKKQFNDLMNKKSIVSSDLGSIKDYTTSIEKTQSKIKNSLDNLLNDLSLINLKNFKKIAQPIKTKIIPLSNNANKINYIFPKMLIILLMFSSLILSSDFIFYDKKGLAYLRNLFSPVSNLAYNFSYFVSEFIIIFLEILSTLILSILILPHFLDYSIISIFLFSLVYSIFFIFLGLLIGNFSKSEENSVIISSITGILLILFSGLFIPLEYLPKNFSKILGYNPIVIANKTIRELTFFNKSLISSLTLIIIPTLTLIIEIFLVILILVLTASIFERNKLIVHRIRLNPVKHRKVNTKKRGIKEEKILHDLGYNESSFNQGDIGLIHSLTKEEKIMKEIQKMINQLKVAKSKNEIDSVKSRYLKIKKEYSLLDEKEKLKIKDLIHKLDKFFGGNLKGQ